MTRKQAGSRDDLSFRRECKIAGQGKEMREKMYKRVCNRLTGAEGARNEAMTQTATFWM